MCAGLTGGKFLRCISDQQTAEALLSLRDTPRFSMLSIHRYLKRWDPGERAAYCDVLIAIKFVRKQLRHFIGATVGFLVKAIPKVGLNKDRIDPCVD
jgi:hypothetical protein